MACSVSKKHLKVHVEQEDAQLDGHNSAAACARNSTAPEESSVSESCKRYKSLLGSRRVDVYKSPTMPEEKVFRAVVSCIGNDGTIFVIPKSFGKVTLRKMCLSLNLMTLEYEIVPCVCSGRHVLYQDAVLSDSCLGGLLWAGSEAFGAESTCATPRAVPRCGQVRQLLSGGSPDAQRVPCPRTRHGAALPRRAHQSPQMLGQAGFPPVLGTAASTFFYHVEVWYILLITMKIQSWGFSEVSLGLKHYWLFFSQPEPGTWFPWAFCLYCNRFSFLFFQKINLYSACTVGKRYIIILTGAVSVFSTVISLYMRTLLISFYSGGAFNC